MKSADALLATAREAAKTAHCPYSNFHVGAAVLCKDGSVVCGCNIENASYGLSMCAERVALFNAKAQGKHPLAIAVSCTDAQDSGAMTSKMPCGACRQVMQELLPNDAQVHIDGVGTRALSQLLPEAFQLSSRPIDREA